jgi:hypothetical protein
MTTAVVLHGGMTNAGLVSRLGDTVRRPARANGAATEALLAHLERVGFDGAPRFLGRDERGGEILSFIPGRAAIEPYEDWALTDAALVSVAALLRRFHDAVASFHPAGHEWPRFVPEVFDEGVISHNDPTSTTSSSTASAPSPSSTSTSRAPARRCGTSRARRAMRQALLDGP